MFGAGLKVFRVQPTAVSCAQKERQANLAAAWEAFKVKLQEGHKKLNSWKEKFKIDLEQEIKAFEKSTVALLEEFKNRGPYEASLGVERATIIINEYRQKLAQRREKESTLRCGNSQVADK